MAIRIIRVNDDPCLFKKCRTVERFDERLSTLIDDMFDTMYEANGVGLAAPQVGILKRIAVIDTGEKKMELVNPEIILSEGVQGGYEGCLSYPGQSGYVERASHVIVRAQDRNGETFEYDTDDFDARAVQHELDHLDGLIYLRLVTEPPEGFGEENEDVKEENKN